MRIILMLCATLLLSACATTSKYQWGSYENDLYASYKDADKNEVMRLNLEAQINSYEQSKVRVAPGLYAELGTLYLQKGDAENAKRYYAKERDAWPESHVLMSALIDNLQRLNASVPAASGAKK